MEDYEIPSLLKKIHDRMKANFNAELKSLGLTWTSRIRRLSES